MFEKDSDLGVNIKKVVDEFEHKTKIKGNIQSLGKWFFNYAIDFHYLITLYAHISMLLMMVISHEQSYASMNFFVALICSTHC
jgi:hypothetical protein